MHYPPLPSSLRTSCRAASETGFDRHRGASTTPHRPSYSVLSQLSGHGRSSSTSYFQIRHLGATWPATVCTARGGFRNPPFSSPTTGASHRFEVEIWYAGLSSLSSTSLHHPHLVIMSHRNGSEVGTVILYTTFHRRLGSIQRAA